MTKVTTGDRVSAESNSGIIKGEVQSVNGQKITINVTEKTIQENGEQMTIRSNEQMVIMDRNIIEILTGC